MKTYFHIQSQLAKVLIVFGQSKFHNLSNWRQMSRQKKAHCFVLLLAQIIAWIATRLQKSNFYSMLQRYSNRFILWKLECQLLYLKYLGQL